MPNVSVGIDIAKLSYQVHLVVNNHRYSKPFRNSPADFYKLLDWLEKVHAGQFHVCMEASSRYWEHLAKFLYDAGLMVSVVNPTRIHNYAKCKLARNKTDPLDAALIADYCTTQNPPLWTPPAPQVQKLQAMIRHLGSLKQMRTQEQNRSLLENPSESVSALVFQHLSFIEQQIEQLTDCIRQHIESHEDLKTGLALLESIPGIAFLTAAKLLGENIQKFKSTRELAAYAGLNPSFGISGTSVRHKPRLSKIGSSHLRIALYLPAIVAMHHNPSIIDLRQRLEERNKHKMVIIGAAMRKLLALSLGVLKSGLPYDPVYSS
jgi:transposase